MDNSAIELDEYGRILIPKGIRRMLNLKKGSQLQLSVKGSEIVLRPRDVNLEGRVRELVAQLQNNPAKPFVEEARREDSKWMTREYCLKKLGL